MKPLYAIILIALLFTACESGKKSDNESLVAQDIPEEEIVTSEEETIVEPEGIQDAVEEEVPEESTPSVEESTETKAPEIKYRGREEGEAERLYDEAEKYEFGDGVKKDINRAIELYRQSAELNYAKAQYSLAFLIKDNAESLKWLTKSAEQGHSEAQYELGIQYQFGYGVEPNIKQSAYWFQQSADNGHKIAQYKLGLMYDVGEGVKQDLKKAAGLYEKSANQGVGIAQFNLAMMYITGEGVDSTNMHMAAVWMDKARNAGIKDAKKAWNKFGLEAYQ